MNKQAYRHCLACLHHWGAVKRADLAEHGPACKEPTTSTMYRAPVQETPPSDDFDEEWFARADAAVRRVADGFDVVLRAYFRDEMFRVYPPRVVYEAVRRFWREFV